MKWWLAGSGSTLIGLVVLLWAGMVWSLAKGQEAILFPAPKVAVEHLDALATSVGAQPLRLRTSQDETVYAWLHPAVEVEKLPPEAPKALLYLHGNGESVAQTVPEQIRLAKQGWHVLKVSPRSYPGTPGVPDEQGFSRDVMAGWTYLTTDLGLAPGRVVVHGRSLGAAWWARPWRPCNRIRGGRQVSY